MQLYCLKCKSHREALDPTPIYLSNGRPATQGICPVCGTKMMRMGATPEHEGLPKPEIIAVPAAERPTKAKTASKATAKKTAAKKTAAKKGTTKKTAPKKGTKKESAKKETSSKRGKTTQLVIVESPSKARSVGSFLKGYTVIASKGHVRDLLSSQLSVDVENDFEPKYRVLNDKRETVKEIKEAVQSATVIYLATDPDREGEAIAWHLMAAADIPPENAKRVVFHEITESAVQHAFDNPRDIDMSLVNAQQARRILDRLVGYGISPLLWERVRSRLSAGRVQSVALRMVVEREREIEQFITQEYWTIDADVRAINKSDMFTARLVKYKGEDPVLESQEAVQPHLDTLEKSLYRVDSLKRGTRTRRPTPPFTTSTVQQEASRRLGFNAARTMSAAQRLYEGLDLGEGKISGLITYMRTDSLNVSQDAQQETREYVVSTYSPQHVPETPPIYKTKAKGAQEAHEAIRPTSVFRTPDAGLKAILDKAGKDFKMGTDLSKLYKLIWERFVASQMANAIYNTLRVEVRAGLTDKEMPYLFRATGSVIQFAGFLALYEETKDEDAPSSTEEGRIAMNLDVKENDPLDLLKLDPVQHFTQPPPRYTEATLVKTLEEYGIGRPSTYAPTVKVIQDRDYVDKSERRLVPTEIGKLVSDLLVEYFPHEMDFQFTAHIEEELDEIAEGGDDWKAMLREFYLPFEQRLNHARETMPEHKRDEEVGRECPKDGGALVIKYGRFGKFIGCSNHPECTHTEPYVETTGIACALCGETEGGQLVVRRTKRGRPFYGCSRYPACEYSTWTRPKRTDDDDEIETVGVDPAAGQD